MKKVLFVASECTPFVKTGGLADVIGSLPQALNRTKKIETRVILPLYDEIPKKWHLKMSQITTIPIQLGWRKQSASLYSLVYEGITYYFISNDYYFSRKGLYGYYDDGERFIFFSKAVIEALPFLDFKPDVLHAHDWQAGMTVALAKILNPVEQLKTVLTIHNIKYQGIMPHHTFADFFNLPLSHFGGFEWRGMLNCLKSGLYHADKITTVSPSYAEEIKQPYFGEGLHPILQERSKDLLGILNGINIDEFNPKTDPHLFMNYQYSRMKKKENKIVLQEKLGLPVNADIPLYIMVTRLEEQKGLHLLQHCLDEFLQDDVQFILLGTGNIDFETYFYNASKRFPLKLSVHFIFDDALARQMYAAADFLIMPSKFEPCGLSQLIALQYKTVPIVRETGGLKDTVVAFDEMTGEGNGFSFTNYNAHDLLHVLQSSLRVYQHSTYWKTLLKNVNKSQFSWNHSAYEYITLYHSLSI
ncbi:glycogen synthase GlgA [Bacillus solitudinis]|uniref:glycogen synthase GlgA n=1 Tax=Bacillus solitudinis TaxID=2014074 RepID=UPI000C239076|nr:glycogen synthase GlgA [Bacillus solitudinis]